MRFPWSSELKDPCYNCSLGLPKVNLYFRLADAQILSYMMAPTSVLLIDLPSQKKGADSLNLIFYT